MNLITIFGLVLGSLVVFQPALNRLILENRGLGFAVWLNGTVLLATASIFCLFIFYRPERFPELVRFKLSGPFHWWYVLPGLFGLMMVTGVPLMIKNIGALSTVLTMLFGQLVTSFFWDFLAGQPWSSARFFGLLLAGAGAYLSFR